VRYGRASATIDGHWRVLERRRRCDARLAAAPDPESRLLLDGCLALGPNLSLDTCFLTSTNTCAPSSIG
jgi:hypothetical protein